MEVRFDALTVRRSARAIIDHLDLTVGTGEVVGLVGPNGCGKSTLLRTVYRALPPTNGSVFVDGRDVRAGTAIEAARRVAALPQDGGVDLDFTVSRLVAVGRFPHGHLGGRLSDREADLLDRVLADTGLTGLRDRRLSTLSGGERQRALLARAMMQQPRVLVLDEPTNHLDVQHQLGLLATLRQPDRTVLLAIHDLNLAALVCDRLAVLHEGRLAALGTPRDVFGRADVLRRVFGVEAHLVEHPVTGAPQLHFALPCPVAIHHTREEPTCTHATSE